MTESQVLDERIRLLTALQFLIAVEYLEGVYTANRKERESKYRRVEELIEAVELVADALSIDSTKVVRLPDKTDLDEIAEFLGDIFFDRRLEDAVNAQFGAIHGFHVAVTRCVAAVFALSHIFRVEIDIAGLPAARRRVVRKQRRIAATAVTYIGKILRETLLPRAKNLLPAAAVSALEALARTLRGKDWSPPAFRRSFSSSLYAIEPLVPMFWSLAERLDKVRDITSSVAGCSPGRSDWRAYEEVCIRALQTMFVPPFLKVAVQPRGSSSSERRDAILPNTPNSGFWANIRTEFDAKNVACEFKNTKTLSSAHINQLRTYLRRPTLGRFGLLFHRSSASPAVRRAQQRAFADDRTLIILIDDELLRRLLLSWATLGSPEPILADQKAGFEIVY